MLVRKSKYDEMARAADKYLRERNDMIEKWNQLVRQINAKGGIAFLNRGAIGHSMTSQFSKDELNRLIQLCHPDKHDGKKTATEMTAKLLKLKGETA